MRFENNGKPEKKRARRIAVISLAALLTLSIIITLLAVFLNRDDNIDYLEDDLGQFISISSEDYKGYAIDVEADEVDARAVEARIRALLYNHRASRPSNDGGEVTTVPVTVGDKAYITYAAYIIDNEGRRRLVGALTSMTEATPYGVGSGGISLSYYDRSNDMTSPYVIGFDEGIIGAVPRDHKAALIKSGRVSEGDKIAVSFTAGGVSLSYFTTLSECDEAFGEGMREVLVSLGVGEKMSDACELILNGEKVSYTDLKIEYAVKNEATPLAVEVSLPANFSVKELRGMTAVVETYFRSTVVYEAPEYNEAFITEGLGISAEVLSAYEGDDIISRHRSMLRAELLAKREQVQDYLTEEAVWDYLVGKASVTDLPEEEIKAIYESTYGELYSMYSSAYSAAFSSPDDFCAWYYGLDGAYEVAQHVLSLSERAITEKLLLYYIARAENIIPTDDAASIAYEKALDEHFLYYIEGTETEAEINSLSGEEREEKIAEIKNELLEYFGEEYFTYIAFYEICFDAMLEWAVIG